MKGSQFMGRVHAVVLVGAMAASGVVAAARYPGQNTPSLEQRRAQLNTLLAEQWEYTLQTQPEFASILGDKRFNDRLTDFSQKQIDRDLQMARTFLEKFDAVDTAGFPEQEALNKTL